jgi:hypothetical protein
MKRVVTLLALAASLILAASPVVAGPGTSGPPLVGTGWRIAPDEVPRVEFSVAAKFAGTPGGTYRFGNVSGTDFTATITCGSTDSGAAVIGGHITSGNSGVGLDVMVFFVDNGSPVFGQWGPDQVSFTLTGEPGTWVPGDFVGEDTPSDFPAHCPPARGATFELQQLLTVIGDIAIH